LISRRSFTLSIWIGCYVHFLLINEHLMVA
jgi:hypothetical protein